MPEGNTLGGTTEEEAVQDQEALQTQGVSVQEAQEVKVSREQRAADASELEDLSIELRELMVKVRGGDTEPEIYSRLYWARNRLGQVVSRYGLGLPPKPKGES
jgi:hypothetical protein